MNDVDITGPLPVIGSGEQPAGWIPEGRSESPAEESAPEPTGHKGGADPDLPWDFATVPAAPAVPVAPAEPEPEPEPGEPVGAVTADLPVVGADAGPELDGPMAPPNDLPVDMPVYVPLDLPDETAAGTSAVPPPVPPAAGSRHGQPAPLSRAWNAGVAAVIAVAAVVVGIIAFQHSSGSSSSGSSAGPAFVLPTSAPTVGSGANLSSPPPGLSALPKASTGGATNAASAGGTAASTAASGVPAGAPSITVLNETATHGLAAAEAEKLRGAGWTVRRVTNISARLTQTTVYYDASQEAAAKALMASVPSIKAALPRPSYVLSTGGLIVVVASDAA